MQQGFIDAVAADPGNEASWLVYADWLQEQPDEAQQAQGERLRAAIPGMIAARRGEGAQARMRALEQQLANSPQHSEAQNTVVMEISAHLNAHREEFRRRFGPEAETSITNPVRLSTTIDKWLEGDNAKWATETLGIHNLFLLDENLEPEALKRLAEDPYLFHITHLNSMNALISNPHAQRFGEGGIAELAQSPYLVNLEVLELGNSKINDDDLTALAHSPAIRRLRELWLGNNNITDAGVAAWIASGNGRRLEEISLPGNALTDTGLQLLANWQADMLSERAARKDATPLAIMDFDGEMELPTPQDKKLRPVLLNQVTLQAHATCKQVE